jgi:hypothetical protein
MSHKDYDCKGSTLKMEVVHYSRTLVCTHQTTTLCHNPEDHCMNLHHCADLKSHIPQQEGQRDCNILCVSEESVLLPALYVSSCYARNSFTKKWTNIGERLPVNVKVMKGTQLSLCILSASHEFILFTVKNNG